uniref:Uncharacterized protein n=1 Tax=Anopheles christyi TaxID=43041 RepID=A0A182JYF6_9DIPT
MMRKATAAILAFLLAMLIFTPHTHSNRSERGDGVNRHVHPESNTHETNVEFWAQLIAYIDCPHVVLLDSFEYFANRPTFAKQLFARLTNAGVRVSTRRQLRVVQQLPPMTHRLAIIVPIVMEPSTLGTDELDTLFGQIDREPNFVEFYRWMFVYRTTHKKSVWRALRQLPIRADTQMYCVIVGPGKTDVPFDERIHLERKMMPVDRFVRRMQMLPPQHQEAAKRTSAILALPGPNAGEGWLAVWQLYRLQTRKKTIDVAVELVVRA